MNLINFLDCICAGKGIPTNLADIVKLIYTAVQIGVPIILIIIGMFDMGKAITQQKEDEIKKAQSLLIKKVIAAGLVFLMMSLVLLVLNVVGGDDANNTSCIKCLLTGEGNDRTLCDANQQCPTGYNTPTTDSTTGVCTCKKDS